jgi:hypothetical protein
LVATWQRERREKAIYQLGEASMIQINPSHDFKVEP